MHVPPGSARGAAAWVTPRPGAILVALAPLAEGEATALVEALLLDRELEEKDKRRIVEAADGNPLFLEQLLALNMEVGTMGELVVPPTIHALLAARIDRLDARERAVLQSAAVEGREFRRSAVWSLPPRMIEKGSSASCCTWRATS